LKGNRPIGLNAGAEFISQPGVPGLKPLQERNEHISTRSSNGIVLTRHFDPENYCITYGRGGASTRLRPRHAF
jgi:hypothetical protein